MTEMSDEEIMKFQSSLREVMLFIKYSKDRENLSRVLEFNEKRFREVERRATDVIEVITNSGIKSEGVRKMNGRKFHKENIVFLWDLRYHIRCKSKFST